MNKKIAELGAANFDIYKSVTNFKIINLPFEANIILLINSIKYKIYSLFSSKTPEEKQLYQMYKNYLKEIKAKKIKIEPQVIDFRQAYNFI